MILNNHQDYHKQSGEIAKHDGLNMKIFKNSLSKHVVIFCPGIPQSKEFNDDIMHYVSQNFNVSCIYPQYLGTLGSDGEFLDHDPSEDIILIIKLIRSGKLGILNDAYITLIGTSFGGGVALSLSNNRNIGKVIALSPLTPVSKSVDREGLKSYLMNNRSNDYRINQEGYAKLAQGGLIRFPPEYPVGKVSIYAVEKDPEINYDELLKETLHKNGSVFETIPLHENEKQHLSWSVVARLSENVRNKIFQTLQATNHKLELVDLFLESLFNATPKENVFGVLAHGSWYFKDYKSNDVDFILVLNTVGENDLSILQHIKYAFEKKGEKSLDLTLVYKQKLDIGGLENFNSGTHGNHYSEIFKYAQTIYGHNPFQGDDLKALPSYTIKNGFRGEVGKYANRLNKEILSYTDNNHFKKYLERIVISLAIAQGKISPYKSNFTQSQDIEMLLQNLGIDGAINKIVVDLLNKDNWLQEDLNKCFYAYNQIHLKSLEFNTIQIQNDYLSNTLSKLCHINNNVTSVRSFDKCDIINPSIKIISCAGFEKGNRDILEEQNQISDTQLNKLAKINIVLQQIQSYFREHFGKELPIDIFFGDYGIKVKNPDFLERQFHINQEACNSIFNKKKINFSRLSDQKFDNQTYTTSNFYDTSIINNILLQQGLSHEFIYGYLKSSVNKSDGELKIIGMSIEEHVNLAHQIITHWNNSLLIYIGNAKKITLMNEIIKTNKHSNILIGIST